LEIYKKEKFDIFGIHHDAPFYIDIGGYWLYKKIKVPYVLEVMHIAGHPQAGSLKEWFYKILERLFVNFFAKKAKAVRIINKKQTGEFLKKAGVDEKKTNCVPAFYIDLDVFKPQQIEKKYDLVFSGRLVKNKGIFLLLKAVKKSKLKLAIIGGGVLENKIKKYIKKHKLRVDFIGWVPGVEDLAKIYNQSKIFVMPSLNEGGPRVCLEAMACKVPVITSRVGIMLDIIDPSTSSGRVNGLFIDWEPEDIIEKALKLLKDESLYKKIAENGYKTAQQFERKKAIKNYAVSYLKLIK
jgi:glycosyltransferase involved in cell wall biosynthesis